MSKRDKKKLEARIGIFLRQYGRKAVANWGDPNDRAYDREIEKLVKQMDPEELDRLMNGEPTELGFSAEGETWRTKRESGTKCTQLTPVISG